MERSIGLTGGRRVDAVDRCTAPCLAVLALLAQARLLLRPLLLRFLALQLLDELLEHLELVHAVAGGGARVRVALLVHLAVRAQVECIECNVKSLQLKATFESGSSCYTFKR